MIESDSFLKYLSRYSSMSQLIPEEIEEFFGNPTRSIRSLFSDRWSELHNDLIVAQKMPAC
ncbi:hypothetical protein ACSBR2_014594 [Camellia fascicularis]